jgi:hypothetical protein
MTEKVPKEKYFDLAGPVEYRDLPLRFTFVLDGREEPVRIVEPTVDLPFPEGGRLLVDEDDTRVCDVEFRFDAGADMPYQLIFSVLEGIRHREPRMRTFGTGTEQPSHMRAVHRQPILERGHVSAAIEMTRGKARLQIQYSR